MMKIILILFFLFPAFLSWGQSGEDWKIKDFNKDGYVDSLQSYYSGGSGFGGTNVTVINGKTGEKFQMENSHCFCRIKYAIAIPEVLSPAKNHSFLEAIMEELLPPKGKADPSLQWILEASKTSKALQKNQFFNLTLKPDLLYTEGAISLPGTYYIDLKGNFLDNLIKTQGFDFGEPPKASNKGFLMYYGHNHNKYQLVDSNSTYKIYKTAHGVIVKKGVWHKWLLVTDKDITGAPDKLRWQSINGVKLINDHVLVEQESSGGEINVYVINIRYGTVGKVKYDFPSTRQMPGEYVPFTIKENSIIFNLKDKKVEAKLTNFFEQLEKI